MRSRDSNQFHSLQSSLYFLNAEKRRSQNSSNSLNLLRRQSRRSVRGQISVAKNVMEKMSSKQEQQEDQEESEEEELEVQSQFQKQDAYDQICKQYETYLLDSQLKLMIKRLSINAYNNLGKMLMKHLQKKEQKKYSQGKHEYLGLPIEKILTEICKKFYISRYEILLFHYTLTQSQWNYHNAVFSLIETNFQGLQSLFFLDSSLLSQGFVRHILIYFLFCAYHTKRAFKYDHIALELGNLLEKISPKFLEDYSTWKQSVSFPKSIVSQQMNHIFKQYNSTSYPVHYCTMAEEIAEMTSQMHIDSKLYRQKN